MNDVLQLQSQVVIEQSKKHHWWTCINPAKSTLSITCGC
ncbi:hypothetical protein Nizo3400_1610 [Lactiplantibacillus plantarum]|nr:hypothetical protein Nizo3400_1610 [Lactiplantibacillus plantarum]